ncbi:hypothetical protein DVA76_18945, partial [Acinetobacter baumannii]
MLHIQTGLDSFAVVVAVAAWLVQRLWQRRGDRPPPAVAQLPVELLWQAGASAYAGHGQPSSLLPPPAAHRMTGRDGN